MEGARTREEKKSNGCTPSFYVDFFGGFLNKKTVCGERSILAVKNPALIFFFLSLAANRNLIKKDIFY